MCVCLCVYVCSFFKNEFINIICKEKMNQLLLYLNIDNNMQLDYET